MARRLSWLTEALRGGPSWPLLALLLGACTGEIPSGRMGTPGTAGPGATAPDSAPGPSQGGVQGPPASSACATADATTPTIRRLSVEELNNAVHDVLGAGPEGPFAGLAGDPVGYKTVGTQLASDRSFTDDYVNRVLALSERIVDERGLVPRCASAAACTRDVLAPYARRLFRRPLDATESGRLTALLTGATASAGARQGVATALAALLTSPAFLFTKGVPAGTARRPATGPELAESLALMLWRSLPDDELLDAAASRSLETPAGFQRQLDRMLADPRAGRFIPSFVQQWLALDLVDPSRVDAPALGLTDALWRPIVSDMVEETRRMVGHVFEQRLPLATLFRADFSILNQRLVDHYRLGASVRGWAQVKFPPGSPRRGLFAQGAMLVQGAKGTVPHLVLRGAAVLHHMACSPPPSPPPGIDEQVNAQLASPGSEKERMIERSANAACSACHRMLDPLGYALHGFDALGRERSVDEVGQKIEPVISRDGIRYGGPLDEVLGTIEDRQVARCLAQNLLIFGVGRRFDTATRTYDACVVEQITERAADSSLRALLASVLASDPFRQRANAP